MAHVVRVQCLQGPEVSLEFPRTTARVRVAEIKSLVLGELARTAPGAAGDSGTAGNGHKLEETKAASEIPPPPTNVEQHTEKHETQTGAAAEDLESAFLLLRGQILADADNVHLYALAPSDFLVLVQEPPTQCDRDDDDDDNPRATKKPRREIETNAETSATAAASAPSDGSRSSLTPLLEMGFTRDQAETALQLAHGDLATAVGLLMGEAVSLPTSGPLATGTEETTERLDQRRALVAQLARRRPHVAPLASLLSQCNGLHELKYHGHRDPFQTLVMLRESIAIETLEEINSHPAAVFAFMTSTLELDDKHSARGSDATNPILSNAKPDTTATLTVIDVDGNAEQEEESVSTETEEAINRLSALGFDRDLVVAIYDSCGQNEHVAANMLLETLQ